LLKAERGKIRKLVNGWEGKREKRKNNLVFCKTGLN
jgi:hypothetical protein